MNRIMFLLLALGIFVSPISSVSANSGATTEGLTLIAVGSAAFYDASYTGAGWDRIVNRHLSWGQAGDDFVYREDGQWCVHPDYTFGNILTLRNPRTGVTLTCTIGDAVASQDQARWRSITVVEVSWILFKRLSLEQGNNVEVWALPGG